MFKDYYSILRASYPSDVNEIQQAYMLRVQELGEESLNPSNLNFQQRVDVEEAFKVLNSYNVKIAYDEEYAKYVATEDKQSFSIQDSWTLSKIEYAHNIVINSLLKPASKGKQKIHLGGKILRFFGKFIVILILIIIYVGIKNCHRLEKRRSASEIKEQLGSLSSSNSENTANYSNTSETEERLYKTANDINQSLPQRLDNNLTIVKISITSSSLIYVYECDDDFFELYKDQFLSSNNHLEQIRAQYSEMKLLIDLLLETHRGISYKYICKRSSETHIVDVPYSKLAGI